MPATRKTQTQPKSEAERLGYAVNVRFTDRQREVLQRIAAELNRPVSTVVRQVVVSWALNHHVADQLQLSGDLDIRAAVHELLLLEDQP